MVIFNRFSGGVAVGLALAMVAFGIGTFVLPNSSGSEETASAARPGGGARGGGPRRGGRAPAVAYALMEPARVEVSIDAIGVARSHRAVDISTEVGGIVAEVGFAPGQTVKKGDLLLQIDDREQQIALTRATAQYPIAKRNADRFKRLAKEDAASAIEAENAINNVNALEADLLAAEFAVAQRKIEAPFDGVVGLTTLEPGDLVAAGQIVTSLDATNRLIVEFTVPQEAARDMEVGQPTFVKVLGAAEGRIEGVVSAIDSRVNAETRTLRVEATVDNSAGLIRPGVTLAVETRNLGAVAIKAPSLAVQWDRTGAYVFVVDEEGTASRRSVQILQRSESDAILSGEISVGDVVVSEGADRVRPGMKLPTPSELGTPFAAGG